MTRTKLRWGILGAAGIARKNWKAIHDAGNGIVTAVASRDLERAEQFIAERQAEARFKKLPQAFGSYEALLASGHVDAVYIPLPTGLRKEWVVRAAQAGKHVLCEKPCAASVADLREMLAACRRHRVQFMDGVMFMHQPRLDRIRKVLAGGESVGPIKRITSAFSFCANDGFREQNIRAQSALEPAGCLGDLGWYCLRFSLWAMSWQLPRQASGRILSEFAGRGSAAAVPLEFSGELFFDGGVSAGFYTSFLANQQQWANVSGAKGYVRVPDFVHPLPGGKSAFEVNYQPVRAYASDAAPSHAARMFRNFGEQVRSGTLNETWPDLALKTQQVLDACFASARKGGEVVAVIPPLLEPPANAG